MQRVGDVIQGWGSPFGPSESLVNLATKQVAEETVRHDLLEVKHKGTIVATEFVENQLITDSVEFYDTIRKLNLKTFSIYIVKAANKEIVVKADRTLFA